MNLKIAVIVALLSPALALAQTAPMQPNAQPTSAAATPSHDDPNWTLAWPTPREITLPKFITDGNCMNHYYPAFGKPLPKAAVTMVEFHVMTDGSIQGVKLDQSAGVDELDEAVLSCVKGSWRYTPATYKDQTVEVTRKTSVNWNLKKYQRRPNNRSMSESFSST